MSDTARSGRTGRGQIMPLVALMLVAIIGMCALAVDGSNMYSQHRRLQADLDVAVKVGSARMWNVAPVTSAYTYTVQQAITASIQTLASVGYPFNPSATTISYTTDYLHGVCATNRASSINATIKLCTPPSTVSKFAGRQGFLEGFLDGDIKGFFGGVIGLDRVHMSVHATAETGGYSTPYALIGLGTGNPNGSGGSTGSEASCSILINSGGSSTYVSVYGSAVGNAMDCAQHTSTSSGTNTDVYGTADYGSTATPPSPDVRTAGRDGSNLVTPITDPFTPTTYSTPTTVFNDIEPGQPFTSPCQQQLVLKYQAGWTSSSLPSVAPSSTHYFFAPITTTAATTGLTDTIPVSIDVSGFGHDSYYFMPGCQDSSPAVSESPALYVFTNDFSSGGSTGHFSINAFDATIVLGQNVKNTGNASWTLDAPTTGPYANMAVTQAYTTSADGQVVCPSTYASPSNYPNIDFTGNSSAATVGNVNLPCANLEITGSTSVVVNGNMTGNTITVNGNGGAVVAYRSDIMPKDRGSVLVE